MLLIVWERMGKINGARECYIYRWFEITEMSSLKQSFSDAFN